MEPEEPVIAKQQLGKHALTTKNAIFIDNP
jgi:hypothetical protein